VRLLIFSLALLTLAIRPAVSLSAQVPEAQDPRRAYATRTELEASLAEAEKVISSTGYSARLREAKAREAETLRHRLRDGDFQVGDQIVISVVGEQQFTDTFTVGTGRTLTLPGMQAISLQGVLRHESETFLKDPEVRIVPMIRLSVLGQIGKPGFYQFPADMVIADAIMQAGGPAGGVNPSESTIRRSGTEIVAQEDFAAALEQGQTLDQLSLRAGDELVVSRIGRGGFNITSIRTVTLAITGVASIIFLALRIF
jgi:hypothetical protein